MRTHLLRKYVCHVKFPNGQDIPPSELMIEMNIEKMRDASNASNTCRYCLKKYSCSASLSRHKKTCKYRLSGQVSVEAVREKEAFKEKVQEALTSLGLTPNTTNNTTNNNTQNNTAESIHTGNVYNVVNINAYGHEDMSYMTHTFLSSCAKEVLSDGLPNFIRHLHLNNEHPENKNIRGKSLRQNTIETYNGSRWILCNASQVLDNLMQKGCKVFWKHYIEHMEQELKDESIQQRIERNIKRICDVTQEQRTQTYYKIRRTMFLMFFEEQNDDFALVLAPEGQEELIENTLNEAMAAATST